MGAVTNRIETRLTKIERRAWPTTSWTWADPANSKTTTSATYVTLWEIQFPGGVPSSMFRTYIRGTTSSGTVGHVRLYFSISGIATSAWVLGSGADEFIEFRWRHQQTAPDTLQLQALRDSGGGSVTIYEPHGLRITSTLDGATTTGI